MLTLASVVCLACLLLLWCSTAISYRQLKIYETFVVVPSFGSSVKDSFRSSSSSARLSTLVCRPPEPALWGWWASRDFRQSLHFLGEKKCGTNHWHGWSIVAKCNKPAQRLKIMVVVLQVVVVVVWGDGILRDLSWHGCGCGDSIVTANRLCDSSYNVYTRQHAWQWMAAVVYHKFSKIIFISKTYIDFDHWASRWGMHPAFSDSILKQKWPHGAAMVHTVGVNNVLTVNCKSKKKKLFSSLTHFDMLQGNSCVSSPARLWDMCRNRPGEIERGGSGDDEVMVLNVNAP